MAKDKLDMTPVALVFKAGRGLKTYHMGGYNWKHNEVHEVPKHQADVLLTDFCDYFFPADKVKETEPPPKTEEEKKPETSVEKAEPGPTHNRSFSPPKGTDKK